jgi:hypothetical protein
MTGRCHRQHAEPRDLRLARSAPRQPSFDDQARAQLAIGQLELQIAERFGEYGGRHKSRQRPIDIFRLLQPLADSPYYAPTCTCRV